MDASPTDMYSQDNTATIPFWMHGADVSSLQRSLDLGALFFDVDGSQAHPLDILKAHGVNFIRLRIWVNPAHGYNNKTNLLQFAPEVKARGMKLLVDFHYSDTWADPAHQLKPAAWADHDLVQLQGDIYAHTFDICANLKSLGAPPDMVQIGNEINPGMLLPEGSIDNWENLAALLKQGWNGVKACSPSIQVMLHIANVGDSSGARAWFENTRGYGVPWDVTGLSYYSYWHGNMADMAKTVGDLKAHFAKPVVIVETAYPFTLSNYDHEANVIFSEDQLTPGYPATPAGQQSNFKDMLNAAHTGGAAGVFYWEPTWTAVAGNGWNPANLTSGDQWENQALFDFTGKALPAINLFR